jgi:hypothetical protein
MSPSEGILIAASEGILIAAESPSAAPVPPPA